MTTPTIGIACHSFRTDGGMGRYVQLLAEGLLNLGIHPTVITKKIDYSLPLSTQNLGFWSCRRRRKTADLLVAQANPGYSRG